jgi:cytochrome c-type biogenesis protein CcmE
LLNSATFISLIILTFPIRIAPKPIIGNSLGNQAAMTTGRKLALASVLVACAIIYLSYLGAAESWQYYLNVDECLTNASMQSGSRLRVNGTVADGSLQIAPDRRQASFTLKGTKGSLAVTCTGTIPDNLAENMDVVVEGRLADQAKFNADKVLTRCASKYQSQNSSTSPISPSKPEAEL